MNRVAEGAPGRVSPADVCLMEGSFQGGRDGRAEEEGGDVESWRYSCLAKFCHCLGMPTEGFEGEILKLLNRMKEEENDLRGAANDRDKRKLIKDVIKTQKGCSGGVWDNRVLQMVVMEVDKFSVSCHFKNCEDGFYWIFTGVYGPTLKLDREDFLSELGAIRGLWSDPWCVAGDFNMIRFPSKRSIGGRLSSTMRRFLEVIQGPFRLFG
ncbi:hypothetical protein CK203_037043 [Vitis vinifera]|uniref:Endonuclease/exonuclease/phosphatase domain-containing protein n=1 Tax=Vitis vinifera TaxID=29760 RepID=A0A438I5Y2_VITVI|nr:hypothetical protein CK203_037043 [Vitis vinifera]